MNDNEIRVLSIGPDDVAPGEPEDLAGYGPFRFDRCDEAQALANLSARHYDAIVVTGHWDGWKRLAGDTAVLVAWPAPIASESLQWLRAGAEDVLALDELGLPSWPRRLRAAVERQRVRASMRTAYATDALTGLPHQQQLIEHMSHLMALREREPSPMALIALRIEGLATTEARLGREAASVLRRKLAVRLRAGLRASDVVASIGGDCFAVLLSSIEASADAERVGAKLRAALSRRLTVAGQDVAVATAIGIASFPEDGAQPDLLLRRAVGLAAASQATGRLGLSNWVESGGKGPEAAND